MSIKHPTIYPGQYAYIGKQPHHSFGTQIQKRKPPLLCPTIHPGVYPHYGKEPRSGLLKIAYEEKFKKINERNIECKENPCREILSEKMRQNHDQYIQFRRDVKKKVEDKIKSYEEDVERRRAKLQQLYDDEEQQHYRETVDKAIRKENEKFENMKRTVDIIKKQREDERKELAHQKKIEQYINLCDELKPKIMKKNLIESKNIQLQQIRENQAKREREKELERMWFELNEKENNARIERDERELLARKALQLSLQETLHNQIRGKQLFKAEEKRMMTEDKIDLEKQKEQLNKDDLKKQEQKRKIQESLLKDLMYQIRVQEEYLRKRREEDEEVTKIHNQYNLIELEREKEGQIEKIEESRKERALYRDFIKELENQRKEEEKKLNELLDIYQKEVQKKHDEANCKLIEGREALQKDCNKGIAQQLALKRQEAENQLKLKQAENELLEISCRANDRLKEEQELQAVQAARQYRDDLQEQIEYNKRVREREREELERQLRKGKEEEEKYQQLVYEIIERGLNAPKFKHPFRRVLEGYDCSCKDPVLLQG